MLSFFAWYLEVSFDFVLFGFLLLFFPLPTFSSFATCHWLSLQNPKRLTSGGGGVLQVAELAAPQDGRGSTFDLLGFGDV